MNVEQGWIERFEAFARSKPGDETYDFTDSQKCAFAQFEKAEGTYEGPRYTSPLYGRLYLPEEFVDPLVRTPQTFGALADRLAAIVKQEPGK